ncbi:MAG: transposase [Clostridiales bacterium]|nr:transposase [Clostridiales bacterium]
MNLYFMTDIIKLYGALFLSRWGKEAAGDSVGAILDVVRRGKSGKYIICEDCGNIIAKPSAKSNKGCPICHGEGKSSWDGLKVSRIVEGISYFHVVFTIPLELNDFYWLNKLKFGDAMYEAAAETLLELASRNLGGSLGAVIVFHSWAQDLSLHPHLHCYIPGRVLKEDGTWKALDNYMLSNSLLAMTYKGKLINALKKIWGALELPDHGPDSYEDPFYKAFFLTSLFEKTWIVYNKKVISVRNAVKYLSDHMKRTSMAAYRIQKIDGSGVSFSWRDSRDSDAIKTMTLPGDEFLRRILLHTFPPGFRKIRNYGVLPAASRKKAR